jgi:hypothetical protein
MRKLRETENSLSLIYIYVWAGKHVRRDKLIQKTEENILEKLEMSVRLAMHIRTQQASGCTPTLYRAATGISNCPVSIKLTGCFLIFHVGSERRILGFSQLNNDSYNNTFTDPYNALCILSSYAL